LTVEIVEEDQARLLSDCPGLTSHIPVFSARAVEALDDLLASAGERIQLRCRNCDEAYVALNVTRVIAALDESAARVKRYSSSGRIMRILQYAFWEERLEGAGLFKIPETLLQDVYATQRVVKRVLDHGLQGFVFKLIWTDAPAVILCFYCRGVLKEGADVCPTCGLDTRRDAALKMSLAEATGMKRKPCRFCGTRIPVGADPCPFCKRGERRQGARRGVALVV
jgi:rRNA maturation endonuclease Nob1